MAANSINSEPGLLDTLKENLNPSTIMKKLNLTPYKIVELFIYFSVGILIGYILKKYAKVVIVLIFGLIILLLLQQLGIISIFFHADKLQELFGIQPMSTSEGTILSSYWAWIKAHVALVLSISIGFLVGLRLGS